MDHDTVGKEILLLLLLVAMVIGFTRVEKLKCVPPSVFAVLLGMVVSLLGGTSVAFASEVFLYFMLPPILFHSSLKFKIQTLRRTGISSVTFAWLGTSMSMLLIAWGIMVWTIGTRVEMSILEALLFASILAPTDTVATISLSKQIKLQDSYILEVLENESVLNDAISVAFVRLFSSMIKSHAIMDKWVPMEVILFSVLYSSIAAVFGALVAMCMNKLKAEDMTVHYVVALIVYASCECLDLSGILGLFVYGSLANVPKNVEESVGSMSMIIESCVYLLLGLALHTYDMTLFGLSLLILISCIVARVVSVFLLGSCLGYFYPEQWSVKTLLFFSMCGIRGAISYALCQGLSNSFIKSTTFVVIMFTIVGIGGLQKCMFRILLEDRQLI
jgi:NhaP-type Na+/H+ or K+/H+ antiporter